MSKLSNIKITEIVREHGVICGEPAWPNTFDLRPDRFDQLLYWVSANCIHVSYGYRYINLPPYSVRCSEAINEGLELEQVWKEMSEENISQPADSK